MKNIQYIIPREIIIINVQLYEWLKCNQQYKTQKEWKVFRTSMEYAENREMANDAR